MSKPIIVLGSLNMDLLARTPHLPVAGETLTASLLETLPGGKGANQAVAAARLGAAVSMIGCLGDDAFGEAMRASLKNDGVGISAVRSVAGQHTGTALITVAPEGGNTIVLAPGANGAAGAPELHALEVLLPQAGLLLLQLEVPLETVRGALALAAEHQVPAILDPAPARMLPKDVLQLVAVLTPNEVEAAQLTGLTVNSPGEAAVAARSLHKAGAGAVVVTLGALGCYYLTEEEQRFMPGFKINAVDTVAAGDAFNGALAVALSEERPWREAIRFATAAGALTATRPGAQPALPSRAEVEAFLSGLQG